MPVDGDLRDFEIGSVVQLLCTEGRSVGLVVRRRGEEGVLYLEEGEIVHALLGPLEGEKAVFELLTWQDGTFRITDRVRSPGRSIHTGWRHLMLEAARQMDESLRDRADAAELSLAGFAPGLPIANDELGWEVAESDDDLEGELMLLLSQLEQGMARLSSDKTRKRPLAALEGLADMLNQAVAFAESSAHGKAAAGLALSTAFSASSVLKGAIARHPMARLLTGQSNRLSVANAASFYRTWAADAAERGRVFRDIARALGLALETFLELCGRRLRSPAAATEWRESYGVFLRDLAVAIDRIPF